MHDCDPPVWPAFLPFDCFPSPTLRGAGGIVQERSIGRPTAFFRYQGHPNVRFDAATSTPSATVQRPNLNDLLTMVALDSRCCPESLLCPRACRPADVGSCAIFREPTFCSSEGVQGMATNIVSVIMKF